MKVKLIVVFVFLKIWYKSEINEVTKVIMHHLRKIEFMICLQLMALKTRS